MNKNVLIIEIFRKVIEFKLISLNIINVLNLINIVFMMITPN